MKFLTLKGLNDNLKVFFNNIIKPYMQKELSKTGSVSFTLNTKIPVFECNSGKKFVVIDADGNIISSADNLGNAKWWVDMESGAGNVRTCYTASSDNYPFETNGDYNGVDVSTVKNCTITYENGNLTITSSWTVVDNKPLTLGTLDLGKILCYKTSS